jgi:MFS family permease
LGPENNEARLESELTGIRATPANLPPPTRRIMGKPSIKQTFSSLSQPSYRILWISMVFQMGAMQIQMMTQGFYVFDLTGSATILGIVTASAAIPTLPLVLFGGTLADRLDKKRIIQAGQLVSLAAGLFIAISITTDTITWYHFLAMSMVQGIIMSLVMPARQALIPQVVGQDRLMNAMALNALGMSVTTMAAPAIAGGLIAAIGADGAYYVMAGMNAASVFFIGFLPKLIQSESRLKTSILSEMGQGFRYMRSNSAIRILFFMGIIQLMLMMPIRFIMPIFAKDVFEVGPEGLGLMFSAMGFGSLAGALFIASVGHMSSRGLVLALTGILSGALLLGFSFMSAFLPVYFFALCILALSGTIQSGRQTLQQSMVMEYTDPEYRGRVMGFNMLGFGIMPAAVLPLTMGSDFFGAPAALGIMAAVFMGVGALIVAFSPTIRKLH